MKEKLHFLFGGLVLVSIVQVAYFFPYMPEIVATHFGAGGLANGWMERQAYMLVQSATTLVLIVIYVMADSLKLPGNIRYVSLPNREYWLDEKRRPDTERFLRDQARWFVFYTQLFLLVIYQLVINANLTEERILSESQMWYSLLIYGIYVVLWLLRFYRHFSIKGRQ